MKKNLISVLILALVFANLVLTTLLIFTILPETKKANNLIDQVCQAISLDLKSGAATSASQIPQEQIADYALNADGENLTFSFAPSDDNSMHILVCGISLSLNKESDGYKQYKEDLSTKKKMNNKIRTTDKQPITIINILSFLSLMIEFSSII